MADKKSTGSELYSEKANAIREIYRGKKSSQNQYESLGRLAQSPGGYISDELRQVAWPLLLQFCSNIQAKSETLKPHSNQNDPTLSSTWRSLPVHKDEGQVQLDVDRSFVFYPQDLSSERSQKLKSDLLEVITATLRKHPKLCYFQGFHDIVQVVLLVLGKELAFDAVAGLSLLRLRDFMLPSLSSSLTHLDLLPAILAKVDPALAQHLAGTRHYFALGATLTLFSHEVENYSDIARLFDFLLSDEAAVAIYLFASIIVSRRNELLEIPPDETDVLHVTLSKLPRSLDIDSLIDDAVQMIESHPPESLPFRVWSKVSKFSVLRTTRKGAQYTKAEALALMDAQLSQMAAQEKRQRILSTFWAWRRPAGGVGAALLVGLLSIWLQRNSVTHLYISEWSTAIHRTLAKVANLLLMVQN